MRFRTISGLLQRAKPHTASRPRCECTHDKEPQRFETVPKEESATSGNTCKQEINFNEPSASHSPDKPSTIGSPDPSENEAKRFKGKKQLRQRIAEVEKANGTTTPPHKQSQRSYSTTSLGACSTYSGRAASLAPSSRSSAPSQVSIEGPSEAEIAIEAIINHYPKLRKGLRRSELPRRQRKLLNKELDVQLANLRTLSVRIKEILRNTSEDCFPDSDLNDIGQKLNMLESKIDLQRRALLSSKRSPSDGIIEDSVTFEVSSAEFESISNQISELLDIVNGAFRNLGTHAPISQISFS